jgi:hypothetical protein
MGQFVLPRTLISGLAALTGHLAETGTDTDFRGLLDLAALKFLIEENRS